MKHQEHILAFTSSFVSDVLRIPEGASFDGDANTPTTETAGDRMYAGCAPYIEIKQRLGLDIAYEGKVSTHRQLLPYMVVGKYFDGDFKVLTYQRAKGIGENRLLGKKSIGIGGHVDLADVQVNEDGVICLQSTVNCSVLRELEEELMFIADDGTEIKDGHSCDVFDDLLSFNIRSSGFINDTSDMVGRDHLGIFGVIEVPEIHQLAMKEDSLVQLGWFSYEELLAGGLDDFENWSVLLIKLLAGK